MKRTVYGSPAIPGGDFAPIAGPFAPTAPGATAATRYVGGTVSGAPTSGSFAVGDYIIDQTGKIWVCTTAGTPGTWTLPGSSGVANATAPATYNSGTQTIGVAVGTTAGTVAAGDDSRFAALAVDVATRAVKAQSLALVVYADPTTAVRPTGYAGVLWVGPADTGGIPPSNYNANYDVWLERAPVAATLSGTQAMETDTGRAGVMAPIAILGSQATETDTGSAGAMHPLVIQGAQATETDTGRVGSMVSAGTIAGSQATETDTGSAGAMHPLVIQGAQATETDTGRVGSMVSAVSAFQLETTTDRYLLEDGSGLYLLET